MLTVYRDWGVARPEMTRVFADLQAMEREIRGAFESHLQRPPGRHATLRHRLIDEPAALTFRAELPGVRPEDLDVRVHGDVLEVRGRRRVEVPDGFVVRRAGRSGETFAHAVALPSAVCADQVTAELRAGVLTVTLPKVAPPGPRTIPVVVK